MRRTLLPALALAGGAALALTLFYSQDSGNDGQVDRAGAGADAGSDVAALESNNRTDGNASGVLEELDLPEGPFDPVLSVPAGGAERLMPPPENIVVSDPNADGNGITQSEVSIAVNGDFVVVGWNDGQGFVDGSTLSGYGYSTDRGLSFTDGGDMPNGGGTSVFGDPSIVALPNDEWIFASLNRGSSSGLTINRGTFNGAAPVWQNAVAYNDNGWTLDKEYLEYDEVMDRVYMSYVGFPGNSEGRLTYSDDGGQSWSNPLTVNTGSSTNGYYPAVGVDGGIYVSWVQPLFSGNADLYVRYSSDGGSSWVGPRVLIHTNAPTAGQSPQCFNRGVNITWPSLAVDRTDGPYRGRVYAVYSDGGANNYDSYLRYSDDNGQSWTDQIKLNDNDNTSEQFWPQVSVGPDGRVTVGWYDRRKASNNNSLCDFYVTQSVDGGETWGPNRRMSDTSVAWCGVPSNIAPNFGDYIECISDDRSVFAVWSDARNGDPDVVFGRMDDYQTLATSGDFGDTEAAPFNADGVAWLIPNEAEIAIEPSPATNDADAAFVSTLFGLLATPPETQGIYAIGGEALSGNLQLVSPDGNITGTFSLVQNGDNDIDFDFESTNTVSNANGLFSQYSMTANLLDSAPGQVTIAGSLRMNRGLGQQPIDFAISGSISLDGAPSEQLGSVHQLTQEARFENASRFFVHTRTMVEDGVVVAIPDVVLGDNPPPLALVKQSPNPWAPGAKIRFSLSDDTENLKVQIFTPDGRMVREVTSGASFRAGEYEVDFDGKDANGRNLPNGGYYLKLQASNVSAAGKLFMVR